MLEGFGFQLIWPVTRLPIRPSKHKEKNSHAAPFHHISSFRNHWCFHLSKTAVNKQKQLQLPLQVMGLWLGNNKNPTPTPTPVDSTTIFPCQIRYMKLFTVHIHNWFQSSIHPSQPFNIWIYANTSPWLHFDCFLILFLFKKLYGKFVTEIKLLGYPQRTRHHGSLSQLSVRDEPHSSKNIRTLEEIWRT